MTMTSRTITVVTPANHVPGPKQGGWTYNHYLTLLNDGQRYEIIDGVLYMVPWPTTWHQASIVRFSYYLLIHTRLGGLGQVFAAPFDVVLKLDTVVQPDILAILNANLERITDQCIVGAPDLVVEIASPSTSTYDRNKKYAAYASAGVSEYWIADPIAHTVEVLILESGAYSSLGVFSGQNTLPSIVVPAIAEVQVKQFFA
jgi:Uma2 family endonuclease